MRFCRGPNRNASGRPSRLRLWGDGAQGQLDLLGFGRGSAPGRLACSLLAWVDPLCGRHDSSCFPWHVGRRNGNVLRAGCHLDRRRRRLGPRRGRGSGRFRYLQAGGQPLAISDLIGPHGPAPDCKRAEPYPDQNRRHDAHRHPAPEAFASFQPSQLGQHRRVLWFQGQGAVPKFQRAGGMASRVFTLARGHQGCRKTTVQSLLVGFRACEVAAQFLAHVL